MALIDIQHVSKAFVVKRNFLGKATQKLTAVSDVSLSIYAGETLGIVGESGCGKSTLARTVLGLYPKTEGRIFYNGRDTAEKEVYNTYRRQVQMIFQDPYASLNPRMTVEDIISEPLRNYHVCANEAERRKAVAALLEEVDLRPEAAQRYPHEFSGGQRQRVGIARALALRPACIFCDEPISALDVSVQVQIVNMLRRFQKELGVAYLFIAHDLAMVHHVSHRIGVMYLGRLVELGPGEAVFHHPFHPYTQMLIASVPRPDPRAKRGMAIRGEVPSPMHAPSGCVFRTRCPLADSVCAACVPELAEIETGRFVACHHARKGEAR